MYQSERLYAHLRRNNLSYTSQRQYFFDTVARLKSSTRPELTTALQPEISHSSSYRLIHTFLKAGVIVQSSSGHLSLSDRFNQHHHTRTCRQCGYQEGFWDQALEKAVIRFTAKSSFVIEDHHFECLPSALTCAASPPKCVKLDK